ncbi:unnamed protein product [Gongylonema pulchrum]|uniref:Uncharacterized protein n=1 Tax=Gongylonema pulchrum TaxID=637853 RepID=A0A183CXL0_9BILA|nr:unnamed protein product [Gongylonema pulchrum]
MKPDVILGIFFCTTKIVTGEILSQGIVKFGPFQRPECLPAEQLNLTASATTTTTASTVVSTDDLEDIQKKASCPCVIKPGSDKCIAYDSRYQAASIEEALVAFQDVTLEDDILQSLPDTQINADTFMCRTLECQTCVAILLDRLKLIGLVPKDVQISLPLPHYVKPENCHRIRFLRPHFMRKPPPPPDYVKKLIEEGWRYAGYGRAEQNAYQQPLIYPARETKFWSAPQAAPSFSYRPTREFTSGISESQMDSLKKEVKREAEPPVLGTRYVISCVRRGEVDDSENLAICGACWTWRKLPPQYFPPLVNELVCGGQSDGHCLSGWGQCQQKYRNFDVLHNVNGEWKPTTISTATCCDCRVRAGTQIHALVVGNM